MSTLTPLSKPWRSKVQRNMAVRDYRLRIWRVLGLFAVSLCLTGLLSSQVVRDRLGAAKEDVMVELKARPEFLVNRFEIEGATPAFAAELQRHLEIDMPMSRFDLDLPALLAQTQTFLNVEDAVLNVEDDGTLVLRIAERPSAFIWKNARGYFILDPKGQVIGTVGSRKDFGHLPLLSGQGAQKAAQEALALLAIARDISTDVYGLQRIGERRWDVLLSQGRRLMLPQEGASHALRRFVFVDQSHGLLAKDFVQVDMRLNDRIFVRWRTGAEPTFINSEVQ